MANLFLCEFEAYGRTCKVDDKPCNARIECLLRIDKE